MIRTISRTLNSDGLRSAVASFLIGFVFFVSSLDAQNASPISNLADVYQSFQNPPAQYSIVPLIRLNDKVERKELAWQFQQLKSQGIHGAFILPEALPHPFFEWKDAGMPYKYLSPEYFEIAREFAEEAKRAGIALWVYDEVDWPSGSAGGAVLDNPAYRSKAIRATVKQFSGPQRVDLPIELNDGLIAVKAYQWDGQKVDMDTNRDLSPFVSNNHLDWSVPQGTWQIAVYTLESNPGFYGHADADLMNSDGVKDFIHRTHERYHNEVEGATGVPIRGTFTDEPHMAAFRNYIGNSTRLTYLPWSAHLEREFRAAKGYDFKDYLPLLYLDGGPETAKIRCDYWKVVSRMFEKNYFGQIAEFDHKAGWISTGHLNGEEDFWWHLIFDGGNEFANQRQFDYPGLDWILPFDYTPDFGVGWLDPFAGKLVSSVAHVYDKPRVMEETFAGSGFGVSFEQMHRMVNWAYMLGVNMLVPISYKYSLRGADRTTSYPPGISYQQPWWSEMKPFSDYVSRLSYLLSQGQYQGRIAFVLPVADVWANSTDREYVETLNLKVHWATKALLRHGYQFDFVDDDSLRGASTQNGQIVIGKNHYQMLVIPPVRVFSMRTMEKIKAYARSGGKVIVLDRLPSGSVEKGNPDPAIETAGKEMCQAGGQVSATCQIVTIDESAETLTDTLAHIVTRPLQLSNSVDGIYSQHRRIGSSDILFLINSTDANRVFDAEFDLPGTPELWDAETGGRSAIPDVEVKDGKTTARLLLRPYQSILVVFNSGLPPADPQQWWNQPISSFALDGRWDFRQEPTMTDPHISWNFVPLPADWKLQDKSIADIHEIGLGNWTDFGLAFYSGRASYEKTFEFPQVKRNQSYLLDLGKVGVGARVWLNDKLVGSKLWAPYTFDVTNFIQPGTNHLKVSVVNTLANYYSQFDQLKDAPLYRGGNQPWMLPSGLMGPVEIREFAK